MKATAENISSYDLIVKLSDGVKTRQLSLDEIEEQTSTAATEEFKLPPPGMTVPKAKSFIKKQLDPLLFRISATKDIDGFLERKEGQRLLLNRERSDRARNLHLLGTRLKMLIDAKLLRKGRGERFVTLEELEISGSDAYLARRFSMVSFERLNEILKSHALAGKINFNAVISTILTEKPVQAELRRPYRRPAKELVALCQLLDRIYENPDWFVEAQYSEESQFGVRVENAIHRERYRTALEKLLQVLEDLDGDAN